MAVGDGKIGFISEDDIADVAIKFLTSTKLGGANPIIVGPELLSYNQVSRSLYVWKSNYKYADRRTVLTSTRSKDYSSKCLDRKSVV